MNLPPIITGETEERKRDVAQANAAYFQAIKTAGLADLGVLTTVPEGTVGKWNEKKPPSAGARFFARLRPKERTGVSQINPFGKEDEEVPKFTHKLELEHCYLHIGIDVNPGNPEKGVEFGPVSKVQFVFEAKPAELAEEMYLGSAKIDVTLRPTETQLTNIEVYFKDKREGGTFHYMPGMGAEAFLQDESDLQRIIRLESPTLFGAVPLSSSIRTTLNSNESPTVKAKKIASAMLLGHNLGHQMLKKDAIPSERFIASLKRKAGVEPEISKEMANRLITEAVDSKITEKANAEYEREVQKKMVEVTSELTQGTHGIQIDLTQTTQYEWIRSEAIKRVEVARELLRQKEPPQAVGEEAVRKSMFKKEFIFDKSINRMVEMLEKFGWTPLTDLLVSFEPRIATHNIEMGRFTEGLPAYERQRLFESLNAESPQAFARFILERRALRPSKAIDFLEFYATLRVPDNKGGISVLPAETIRDIANKSLPILPRIPLVQGLGTSVTHNGVTLSLAASVNEEVNGSAAVIVDGPSYIVDDNAPIPKKKQLESTETMTCGLAPGADIAINQVSYSQITGPDGNARAVTLAHRGVTNEDSVECRIYVKGDIRFIEFWQVPKIYLLDEEKSKPGKPVYRLRTEALMPCLPEEVDEAIRKEMLSFAVPMIEAPKEGLVNLVVEGDIMERIGSTLRAEIEAYPADERKKLANDFCEKMVFDQVEVMAKRFMQNFYQVTKAVGRPQI